MLAAFKISLRNFSANIYLSGINLTKCKYIDRSFLVSKPNISIHEDKIFGHMSVKA